MGSSLRRSYFRFLTAVLLATCGLPASAQALLTAEQERQALIQVLQKRFPGTGPADWQLGAEGLVAGAGTVVQAIPFDSDNATNSADILAIGKKRWERKFKDGKSFAHCFPNGGKRIAYGARALTADEREVWVAYRDRRKLELLAPEVVRPGIVELLDGADKAGVALAVASSSPVEWVVPHLERLDLLDRFAHVVTRTDVGGDPRRTKPAPDIYEHALRALGASPACSVALEDSLNGLAAARAAGLRCVVAPGPVTTGLDFSAADLVVDSLAEVSLGGLAALIS